ncbi:MAG: phosphatase PAP2 family protein [Methanobrevibacter sp.]|nr:phosphatase PAP2 family protein [Methanobrevibacter sp.]
MPLITDLGSVGFVFLLSFTLLIIGHLLKNSTIKKIAIIGIIALIITELAALFLKLWFSEPRPYTILKNVNLLIEKQEPFSFPSGHTANAFAIATAYGFSYKLKKFKIRNKAIYLAWFSIPIAILIGFSRIYIGVHYPFDVIAGALLGIVGGLIAIKIFKRKENKNKNRNKNKNKAKS